MPWQDIGACVFGDGARDVARHFVQRWNFIKTEKKKSFAGYPLLLPRDGSLPLNDESDPLTNLLKESVNCEIQVLRSCGEWSSGLPLEQSILNAYLNLIEQAEHFIYIENQYFISSIPGTVENGIGDALVSRIARSHRYYECLF
jgi:phospholipase D1/2